LELVTSVITFVGLEAAATETLLTSSVEGGFARTGVNPVREMAAFLRERGVTASGLLLGALSGVKTWAGTASQASKSSGALRFLPIDTAGSGISVDTG
jgi:hypothetical protein